MKGKIRNVAVLGRGALGLMYADFFKEKLEPRSVFFLSDETRAARYRQDKVTVQGKEVHFDFFSPERPPSLPCDLLIVALKGPALKGALKSIKGLLSGEEFIISVMNGISSEEIIEQELENYRIIHCVAQKMDALFQKGALTYQDFGELVIGLSPEHRTSEGFLALEATESFFKKLGFPYVRDEDIIHRMWCKWMLNIGLNQTLAVFDGTFKEIHSPGKVRETFLAAMREVLAVSQRMGTGLTEKDFEDYVRIAEALNPDGMPSMRQDRLAKRATEADFFAGTLIPMAEKAGVAVPVNKALYEKIKAFEQSYR